MSDPLDSRMALAHLLADAAGACILPYFRMPVAFADKGQAAFDPVTAADRAAEELIRTLIAEAFPEDSILGEEMGEKRGTSRYRWIIDPLDGTRAFLAGQPLWGTLIALENEGKKILGMMDQPFTAERFVGVGGLASVTRANVTTPLQTRACEKLASAVLSTTHPNAHMNQMQRARYYAVERETKFSRYGGDCYGYGLLAMGVVDLVIEANLQEWDIAALIPIIENAGGIITDWRGLPVSAGGDVIAAGDARVHSEALALLA